MFKTAIQEDENPERLVRTSSPSKSKRIKLKLRKELPQEEELPNYSTLRPLSSPMPPPDMQDNFNNSFRSSNLVNMRTIDAVEGQLEGEFKGEMCGYLRKKLRHLVGKRQSDIAYSRYLNSTLESNSDNLSHVTVGPLDQFYSSFRQKNGLKV